MIDVDGVVAARAFLDARARARALRAAFEDAVRAPSPARALRADARRRSAPRKLAQRRACATSARIDDAPARALARRAVRRADNMTDAIAALVGAQATATSPERDDLFARFEARWRDEPLVLDKWFALRGDAAQRAGHARARARRCSRIRASTRATPIACARWSARSRSRNFARFHAADGAGYAFAADQVLALDATNPQLAATLAGAFNLWKRFPAARRGSMEAALQRIAAAPGLSPDVIEVVTRTLDR